jgi:hypothetical protein
VAFLEEVERWLSAAAERVDAIVDHLHAHRATDVLLFLLTHPRVVVVAVSSSVESRDPTASELRDDRLRFAAGPPQRSSQLAEAGQPHAPPLAGTPPGGPCRWCHLLLKDADDLAARFCGLRWSRWQCFSLRVALGLCNIGAETQ